MTLHRRQVLQFFGAGAALAAAPRTALGQAYPSRTIRWLVGAAAGSSPDVLARLVGQPLSERLGQPIVVENKPGAGGNLAVAEALRAPADGYSILFVTSANAINATLYKKLTFDFVRDIAPVAGLTRGAFAMLVHPSLPVWTLPEFITFAKTNPGKLNLASAGNGTVSHLAGELLKSLADVQLRHVPYRSGPPALNDLIGGHVDVMFDLLVTSLEHVKDGKLRALAITTATRSPVLADLPTMAETVPGYEASATFGVGVSKGTPVELIRRLNTEINSILREPSIVARLAELGAAPLLLDPDEYARIVAGETEKWGNMVRLSGATIE